MAQLPYLTYGQVPPMSSQEFKKLAQSLISKSDASLLDYLSLMPDYSDKIAAKCGFLKKWRDWEFSLRLGLAKQRAIKLKQDVPLEEPKTSYMDAAAVILKAIDEGSPLKGEIMLDKARWYAIEEITGSNYFHRDCAFAYFLKLLLLERRQSFDVDKGFDEYKSLYASIVDSVHNEGDLK
ncbi:MAG: DUF2764 domain-containing protein [Treponema sp.]|nr:DUF2764 domain-containing protein [Treponema sp.]